MQRSVTCVKKVGWMKGVAWVGIVSVIFSTGCGPTLPPAEGLVRFDDGQPVRSGSLEFRSIDGGDRYAGRIGPDGGFRLVDESGDASLPPGRYEVVVVQIVLTEDLVAEAHTHGTTVPRRYADYYTSDLRYTNSADRTDPIEITLQTE